MTVETQITALLDRVDAAMALPAQLSAALANLNIAPLVTAEVTARQGAAVAAAVGALNVPAAVDARWQSERPAILASAAAAGDGLLTLFVSTTGSDLASGTEAAPFATIAAALAKVPVRGRAEIRLLSDIIVAAPAVGLTPLIVEGERAITVMSATDMVLRSLSWATAASTTAGNLTIRPFELRSGALRFHKLRVVPPVASQTRMGERIPVKVRSADPTRGPIAMPMFSLSQCTLALSAYYGGGQLIWTSPDDVTATLTPFPMVFNHDAVTWQFTGRGANVSTIGLLWAGSLEDGFASVARAAVNTHTLPWLMSNLASW